MAADIRVILWGRAGNVRGFLIFFVTTCQASGNIFEK